LTKRARQETSPPQTVRQRKTTISRVFRILECLVHSGTGMSIRDLASAVGAPSSTVHRLCKGMAAEGVLVWQSDARRYDWGPSWFRLTGSMSRSDEMRRLALPIMEKVTQLCNETTLLVRYDRTSRKVTLTDQVECAQPLRYHPVLGVPLPAHAGASGKAVLAFLPGGEIERILAAGLETVTARTITDPARLRRDLAEIRKRGYCVSHGERTLGAVGLACPIFDGKSNVVGALMVTIPEYRFNRHLERRVVSRLREEAERLSRLLGMSQDLDYPLQSRHDRLLTGLGGPHAFRPVNVRAAWRRRPTTVPT